MTQKVTKWSGVFRLTTVFTLLNTTAWWIVDRTGGSHGHGQAYAIALFGVEFVVATVLQMRGGPHRAWRPLATISLTAVASVALVFVTAMIELLLEYLIRERPEYGT